MTTSNAQILRLPEVVKLTGLSRGTIYGKIKEGSFPKQIILGPRCSGWYHREVTDWINTRPRASLSQG